MPRLATVVAGQSVHSAQTAMQDTQQRDAVDVFVGVDVGKGQHHAVALDRNGIRQANFPRSSSRLIVRHASVGSCLGASRGHEPSY
ncbi:hypothetical protein CFB39_39065 [Burkholderia sp. AU6039]|nr:hypothetical protein CFB39_39065 [Burkholderia sp. AU6039]